MHEWPRARPSTEIKAEQADLQMKYYRNITESNSLSLNHTERSILMQRKQPCPLTPSQIISIISPSNTKQQPNPEILPQTEKLGSQEQSWTPPKVRILRSNIEPPKAALLQACCSQGNQGAEMNEMFGENDPRELKIQCL